MRRSFILICVALLLSVFANAQGYDITVNITGNGTVTYGGEAVQNGDVIPVDENATPAFTIAPTDGNRLVSVMLDGVTDVTQALVGNVYTFEAVIENHTLNVTFEEDNDTPEPTMFGITFVGLVEGNTVTVPENARVDSVASGENYVFGITLATCQEAIASVTVGGTELAASEGQYTIENVESDTTITVAFTKYQYTVTAEAGEHGAVAEGFASREIECGTDYTIEFVPEPNYRLEKIILDEVETTEGIEGNNFTLTNVVAAHAVSATFEEIPVIPEPTMFGITFVGLVEGNTITVPENARVDSVASGENYVFGITLTSCQEAIASVTVGGTVLTASEGQYTIENIESDTTVTVAFTKYQYTVTAEAGEHGAVAEGFASREIDCGTDYTIEFVPEPNYRLEKIILDEVETTEGIEGNNFTLTNVVAAHAVSATFEEIPVIPEPTMFGITFVGLDDDNTVTIPENARVDSVASGENYVFGITLATCQEAIASVTVGGTELAASEGQYTIENVVSDTTVTVVFTKYQYTVTAEAGEHGAVAEGFASREIECGTDYTIEFVPEPNYRLEKIILDEVETTEGIEGNNFTLTNVVAAHAVSATFEEIPVIPEPTMFGITFVGLDDDNTVTVPENARVDSVASGENYVFGITLTSCQEAIASVTVGGTVLTASEGQYTIENIESDTTVTVAFTKYQYTVTAEAGEHGAVAEGFASKEIECGADYTIEFVPEPNYRLEKIILDEVETTEGIEGNNFTLTNVVAAHAVSATFEEIPVIPEPTMFGITFVGLEEGDTIIVPENARVDSVAPGENYVFGITLTSCQEAIASVTVGGTVLTASEGQYTIENVVSDTTVTVEFTKYFYTVTAEAGEHGAVAEGFASNDVECGTDYAITFVPDEGYILDSVVVDGVHVTTGISRNTFTLTNVDSLHVVKGFFATDTNIGSKYRITFAGLGANDSIVIPVTEDSTFVHTAAIKDSVLYGDDFVFAINAERCHYVSSVTVNGTAIEADTEGFYTIEGIYCDTTVTVGFTTYRYTVTASAGEHGRLVSDAEAEVECGSSLTFSFVPDAGYKLGSVLLDGESTTLGVNGNTYTLTVYDDHTVVGVFTEFRGPYIEYEGLVAEYEVGDTIDFSLRMHANCMFENICGVGYAVIKGTDTVADVTRFGVLSYKVNVTDDSFVGYQIENGAGMMTYTTEYDTITYNVGAFTLGLFDEAAGRNRTIDYNMIFTTAGQYRIANTLYTCSNGGELIGSNFVASECDDLTHNDRVAEVCANPTPVYSIYSDINITGETIHTITTTVLGGHGSVDPEGTIIVPAGSTQRIQFIPDEYYALDTVKSNGFLIYPSLQTQYVVDSVFVIDSVTENYNITVSFKDVRPYYTVHVEVATAGGTVTPKDTTVVIGSDVTLTITPNEGYHISQLSIDGNIIANYASNEIIFRDINEDHEVSISFFPNSVEDEMFSNLSIYPNPNNGQFTVSSDDFDGNVTFQIYSISGAIMDEMSINGEKSVSFSKSLPAGTYFLRIIAGDKVATRKIVVE